MKKDLSHFPIENFVPHRSPMLLLDTLLHVNEDSMEASFTIDEHCIFLQEDDNLEPVALMEILAQSFAAGNGHLHPTRFGYLASMKAMKVQGRAQLGDTLHAKVQLLTKVGDIMVVEGSLYKETQCILEGQFKIYVLNEDGE